VQQLQQPQQPLLALSLDGLVQLITTTAIIFTSKWLWRLGVWTLCM
jgi:hypothetical protein